MLQTLIDHGYDIRRLSLADQAGFEVMFDSAGYEERRNEVYSWDGLARGSLPFLVIQHTLLGEGRLNFAGTVYRLRSGDCMLVSIPHAHRYYLERGSHWEYFWLILVGAEALRLARSILDRSGPVLRPSAATVDGLAGICHRLVSGPRYSPGEASAEGYRALTLLYDTAHADVAPGTERIAPQLARVMAYVESNLAGDLRIDALARVAGQSRAHFVRAFTGAVGMAPSDFAFQRRMERVERLLLATEMRVSDIAGATGFADANYLAKAFRRHRGMAPLAYRATRQGTVKG